MKNKIIVMLTSLIITLSGGVCAQTNLITNPGFASKVYGWNGTATAVYGTNVKSGTYAARVGTSSATFYQTLSQKLVPGKKYRLSFYGKLSSTSATAKLSLRLRDAAGSMVTSYALSVLSTSYSQYSKEFTFPANATSASVVIVKSNDTGYVYVDDFSLTEISNEMTSDAWTTEFMSLVNAHRDSIGLDPLIHTPELGKIAAEHSQKMASGAVSFGHTGFSDRCSRAKTAIGGGNWCGENVAAGQTSPQSVFNSWMNSSGHRANIEQSRATHTGLGYARSSSGKYYWTNIFVEKY